MTLGISAEDGQMAPSSGEGVNCTEEANSSGGDTPVSRGVVRKPPGRVCEPLADQL